MTVLADNAGIMSAIRLDLPTLLQVAIPLAAIAAAWGNNGARLDAQAEAIQDLQQAIQAERAERLAVQAQEAQQRMAWLLARSGQRLDPQLSAVATAGAAAAAKSAP